LRAEDKTFFFKRRAQDSALDFESCFLGGILGQSGFVAPLRLPIEQNVDWLASLVHSRIIKMVVVTEMTLTVRRDSCSFL
jgi:hypothetical protein